jgi:hypothetical protein
MNEPSLHLIANHRRRSIKPLPSASPYQNPRLLPCLPSCRTEYLLLCVGSITHYLFYLHLNLYRVNVNNNKRAAQQNRVTRARCLLLRYFAKCSFYALSPSAVCLLQLLLLRL